MWLYLPIVSLLFRSVIGYSQTENNILDLGLPRNGNNDVLNEQNEQSAIASKEWKEGWSFNEEGSKTQSDPNITISHDLRENDDPGSTINDANHRDSSVKMVSKRSEIAGSWINLPLKDKKSFQNKKIPKVYWWGDKRIRFYRPRGGMRRLYRLRFNGWGGKRATYFVNKADYQAERTDLMCDLKSISKRCGMERAMDICKDCKSLFDSWDGKRVDRVTDVDEFMETLDNTNKQDEDTMELRNDGPTSLDNWQDYPYSTPEVPVLNEINDNESVTDEDIADNDWLTSTPQKRVGNEKLKKMVFGPWRGKKYSEPLRQAPVFYAWGG